MNCGNRRPMIPWPMSPSLRLVVLGKERELYRWAVRRRDEGAISRIRRDEGDELGVPSSTLPEPRVSVPQAQSRTPNPTVPVPQSRTPSPTVPETGVPWRDRYPWQFCRGNRPSLPVGLVPWHVPSHASRGRHPHRFLVANGMRHGLSERKLAIWSIQSAEQSRFKEGVLGDTLPAVAMKCLPVFGEFAQNDFAATT